jgi:hypothetical protein
MSKEGKSEAQLNCKCGTCMKKVVSDGVQCEICSLWFHCKCQQINDELFGTLTRYEKEIHWFCNGCRKGATKLLSILAELQKKLDNLEEYLEKSRNDWRKELSQTAIDLQSKWSSHIAVLEKDDLTSRLEIQQKITNLIDKTDASEVSLKTRMDILDNRITSENAKLQTKVDNNWAEFENKIKKMDELLGDDPIVMLQKPDSWADKMAKNVEVQMKGVAVEVSTLQERVRVLQKDKEEQDEISKRKQCVIIHGLKEPSNAPSELRKKEDEDAVIDLLHHITCDDVSVNAAIRLGKNQEGPEAKPRPIKLILQSEAQKEKILQNAKNLKTLRNGLEKVFIHQDLTPKQREARQQLVKELKARLAQGEQNLIIVGEKIVTKRQRILQQEIG